MNGNSRRFRIVPLFATPALLAAPVDLATLRVDAGMITLLLERKHKRRF